MLGTQAFLEEQEDVKDGSLGGGSLRVCGFCAYTLPLPSSWRRVTLEDDPAPPAFSPWFLSKPQTKAGEGDREESPALAHDDASFIGGEKLTLKEESRKTNKLCLSGALPTR